MSTSETIVADVVTTILVFVVAGAIGESLLYLLRRAGRRTGSNFGSVRLVRQLVRVMWIGLALLVALTVWGVAPDVLTALVVGIVALAVSLGLQNTLANMISGVYLLYDGAIRVGDHIEHFTIKGVVVRVALRNTWVRTETGQIAVIGNTKLADGPTLNRDLAARFLASESAQRVLPFGTWHHPTSAPPPETTESK